MQHIIYQLIFLLKNLCVIYNIKILEVEYIVCKKKKLQQVVTWVSSSTIIYIIIDNYTHDSTFHLYCFNAHLMLINVYNVYTHYT